jgi:5-methylcytosine-specific restriction enzyme subunit McrC
MSPRVIELAEYRPRRFAEADLSENLVAALHHEYSAQVQVEAPTFLNNRQWCLTSQGWVGHIPLTRDTHFSLIPKLPVRNVFVMLKYAYNLAGFRVLEGLTDSESVEDLYDHLARILAERILVRIRSGLYRAYVPDEGDLPFIRGRLNLRERMRAPARVTMPCCYEEHTADLGENQIPLWTLTRVLATGVCSERTLPFVRQAWRSLRGFASVTPHSAEACADRPYNRLNDDYRPMHALCRFLLENTGPTHRMGDRQMLPVLVDMERLFEQFVCEWLRVHAPPGFTVRSQERVNLDLGHAVSLRIDITIEDARTGETICVVDTKYKADESAASHDLQQVVAYAAAKNCRRAVLVYPVPFRTPIRGPWSRQIDVRSVAFCLDGDLETAGRQFLAELFGA